MQNNADNASKNDFIELSSVDSTNNYALRLVREGMAHHGLSVFAHEQYAGKGQRGRIWKSANGQNVHLSTILATDALLLSSQFTLSALVAVVVRRFFAKLSQSDIFIKWPNDIYFQDRKAAGILIENNLSGAKWNWAVVGMGVNINQTVFDENVRKAVSLRQITGQLYNCVDLAIRLQSELVEYFNEWKNTEQKEAFTLLVIQEYNQFLYKRNEVVRLQAGEKILNVTVDSVEPNGRLRVLQKEGCLYFTFGEVRWL